jgi:GAF domain-containing protein
VDAERGLLFLLEGQELACRLALARAGSPLAAPERDVPRQVLEWVLRRRRGLITEDAALDDRLDYSASVADLNVRSLLAAPLFDGDELVGLVYVDRRARGSRFADEARDDFEATCADLGRLVASARSSEDRERELRELREGRAPSSDACSSPARAARARRSSREPCTPALRARTDPSSLSTAAPCRSPWSTAFSSAT